ncbi:hypothetical protein R3P38DRAFT_3235529 [Favolaschia claudopus]|uniref:Uncharacterized protein n=1 Tax=Favolaschia claudopus TaxID=2862362 RepID=A0AAV9ZDU8_9AGAR
MPRAKSNLSQKEVLLKRADAAYAYRQRNKASVNEKARLRMRRRRAELKLAPSAVQMEYLLRARKHRRDYRECVPDTFLSTSRSSRTCQQTRKTRWSEGAGTRAASRVATMWYQCEDDNIPHRPRHRLARPHKTTVAGRDYYDGEDEDDGEDWEDDDGGLAITTTMDTDDLFSFYLLALLALVLAVVIHVS